MQCLNCNSVQVEGREGTYYYCPAKNGPNGPMLKVGNAIWLQCQNCGWEALPIELQKQLRDFDEAVLQDRRK